MRRRISAKILLALGVLITVYSCHQSDYAKLEKAELAKGVKYDSLFHGIQFGQSKKVFYDICWEKNRQGLFTAGNLKNYVNYTLNGDSSQIKDIEMFFYPEFDSEETIIGMDLEYKYKAWAPWNEDLTSAKLLPILKDTLMNWYGGNQFMQIEGDESSDPIWVKVDGNRRIAIKAKDEERLQVKMVDLTADK